MNGQSSGTISTFTIPTGGSGIWHFGVNVSCVSINVPSPVNGFLSFRWIKSGSFYADHDTIELVRIVSTNTITFRAQITASGLLQGDTFSIGYFLFTSTPPPTGPPIPTIQYNVSKAEAWKLYNVPTDITS